jgi:serine protease Do
MLSVWHASAMAGADCPEMHGPFAAPASEIVAIVNEWFSTQGYAVRRENPRPGYVHLTAWTSEETWEVTVRPRSALASTTTVVHVGAAASHKLCRRLRDYIDGYLAGNAPAASPPFHHRPRAVPAAVLDQIEAVVCIRADANGRNVQFSGFVVDPNGLVLCTAHDLSGHQRVTLTFQDGSSLPGVVVRLDLRRDLALVECPATDLAFVSLSTGRNLLGMGERVYAIGCPNDLAGTLVPGTINGPPRLVGDQPLWQVGMDVYPGSSGGPVFDDQGLLVAMVKGRYRGTTTVGFLTPLETIVAFLLNPDN